MDIDLRALSQVIKEFLRALAEKRTYSIGKNWYSLFGILWGIPIPVVTIGIDLYLSGLALNLSNIARTVFRHPFHILFLLHPVMFGVVFGAMGTVRHNKDRKIKEFEKDLINKNSELEESNKKLQELDQFKSNFLSMISHELRTPLTTIEGYISFLRTERMGNLNNTQKECLKISEEATDTLKSLIEELLDLSKIESGEFKVNLAPLNMYEAINKAILSLQIFADNQGVILENRLSREPLLVLADEEKITQVVTNLVENAIKFNRKGGHIDIEATPSQGNKVIFCVSDTGIGIPQDKLEKIFDKFYQVDSSQKRQFGGCGLGLAISKSIIELHGGKIWAESKLGLGSKFFFELNTAASPYLTLTN